MTQPRPNDVASACPECQEPDRRGFMRQSVFGLAALSAGGLAAAPARADELIRVAPRRPAEDLIRELHASLSDTQKAAVTHAWDMGAGANAVPVRHRIFNAPIARRVRDVYTEPQREIIDRIVRSMCADDEGYTRMNTVLREDGGGLPGAGADIFGDPTGNRPFAFVLTSHHLTLRCDGNSEPNAAFGGPMYYGKSQSGNNRNCIFNFQTEAVRGIYDALSEQQKRRAVVTGSPGEGPRSIAFRGEREQRPGLGVQDLTPDQRNLVERVMRDILSPYRAEDADEVIDLIRRNGGFQRLHLAFYQDPASSDQARWHFWRLEGPGFVWNYRILPHVHCYVNIAQQA